MPSDLRHRAWGNEGLDEPEVPTRWKNGTGVTVVNPLAHLRQSLAYRKILTPSRAEYASGGRTYFRSLLANLLSAISAVLVSLAIAAPILESLRLPAAEPIYRFLSFICHQIPSRSAFIMGSNVGLCYRCLALYGAIGVAVVLPLGTVIKRLARTIFNDVHDLTMNRLTAAVAGLFILILFLDGVLPLLGWPLSTNPRRILTGVLGGWAIVSLLVSRNRKVT